jgi:hypothetical protein
MTGTVVTAGPPRAVIEIKDTEDSEGGVRREISINQQAIPGRGEDDLFTLLALQVLDATKINQHKVTDATERYNATIAALHDIAPKGALEGMLATQLIATHMATMDCYKHLNKTNDRKTHEYHLNQVINYPGPMSLYWMLSIAIAAKDSRKLPSSTSTCIKAAKPSSGTSSTRGVG